MKKGNIFIFLTFIILIFIFPLCIYAHPGRTDGNGGHHDYKNQSGLGSYHYHHGMPAHLHPGGVCPYGDTPSDANETTEPKPSITVKNPPGELIVGQSTGIEYSVENAKSSASKIISSDESVVRVNEDKTLTAISDGVATITVSSSDASKSFDISVRSIPVESIIISNIPDEIQLGTTMKLEAEISPDNATNKSISWSSSDPNIIDINQDGNITCKSVGTSVISCQAINGKKGESSLNVFEIFPEEIRVDVENINLECEKTQDVIVNILPENANNKNYKIEIKNDKIASVQNNKQVKALQDGSTELLIFTDNGLQKVIPISIYHNPVKSITIDDSKLDYTFKMFSDRTVDVNDEICLDVVVKPDNATYKEVSWESSDRNVVKIESNSKFLIVGTGSVTITASGHDHVQAIIKINVINKSLIISIIILCSIIMVALLLIYVKKHLYRIKHGTKEM